MFYAALSMPKGILTGLFSGIPQIIYYTTGFAFTTSPQAGFNVDDVADYSYTNSTGTPSRGWTTL
jgi:hypothetical protein